MQEANIKLKEETLDLSNGKLNEAINNNSNSCMLNSQTTVKYGRGLLIKGTSEYQDMRRRNNEAIKKCRMKKKQEKLQINNNNGSSNNNNTIRNHYNSVGNSSDANVYTNETYDNDMIKNENLMNEVKLLKEFILNNSSFNTEFKNKVRDTFVNLDNKLSSII